MSKMAESSDTSDMDGSKPITIVESLARSEHNIVEEARFGDINLPPLSRSCSHVPEMRMQRSDSESSTRSEMRASSNFNRSVSRLTLPMSNAFCTLTRSKKKGAIRKHIRRLTQVRKTIYVPYLFTTLSKHNFHNINDHPNYFSRFSSSLKY